MSEGCTSGDDASHRTCAIVVWALLLSGLFAIAGVVMAHVKRRQVAGTLYETHLVSAIRTFWFMVVGLVVGAITSVVWIGIVPIVGVYFWVLYRGIRGILEAIAGRPVEVPVAWA